MKRNYDLGQVEMAMRVVERTRIRHAARPDFIMADLVVELVADFGCSESTAFRYVRTAVDVLGIHYDGNARRAGRIELKRQDAAYAGQRRAKHASWPNGRPGRAHNLPAAAAPPHHPWKRSSGARA